MRSGSVRQERAPVDFSQLVSWTNESGLTVPAFGVVQLTAITDEAYEAVRPTTTEGLFFVNGPVSVAASIRGESYLWSRPQRVKCSEAGLAVGDVVGPEAGSWEMSSAGTGFMIMVPPDSGVAIVERSGGSGGAAATDCCCPCTCIDEGDIDVDGVETSSRWAVPIPAEVEEVQANGSLVLPAATHYLDWDGTVWKKTVTSEMTAKYTSGADATGDTTMTGVLTLRKNDGGFTTLKLVFTGTVPPE